MTLPGATPIPDSRRRNNTLHYQRRLLASLRPAARTAIDVGCGEGVASRALSARGLSVVGIDVDEASLCRARAQASERIRYVHGDVFDVEVEPADVVFAGAMLHHVDLERGLARLAELVAPGGRLVVVGLARSIGASDALSDAWGMVLRAADRLRGPVWDHGAPMVWPPPHSYAEVSRASAKTLPGRVFSRRARFRYTVEWDRS